MGATQPGNLHLPPRADPDAGFTLAELLAAITIMVVVLVAVLGALSFATTSSLMSSKRARALSIANDQLEWARNMDYDAVGVVGADITDPQGTIPALQVVEGYSVETSITYAEDTKDPDRDAYKLMIVTVSWDSVAPVVVTSAIYGKAGAGKGSIVVDIEDVVTGAAVSGATASLSLDATPGVVYSLPEGDVGEYAVFDIPSGYARLVIAKAGYFFDKARYGSVYVTPGQESNLTKTVQSTAVTSTRYVTVRKTDGTPLQFTELTLTGPGTDGSYPDLDPTQSTDTSGTAVFTHLLIGTYSISAPGYTIGPDLGITAGNYTETLIHDATATQP